MHVYLTGFMGAGKTTVGEALAELMGRPFIDLDRQIETLQSMSIREIFEARGEEGFRLLESQTLRQVNDTPAVVSLGGGVQTRAENREWLRENGTTVWLDLPLESVMERLRQEDSTLRPMLKSDDQISRLYRSRLIDYSDSDMRIEVSSSDSAADVASKICQQLKASQCAT